MYVAVHFFVVTVLLKAHAVLVEILIYNTAFDWPCSFIHSRVLLFSIIHSQLCIKFAHRLTPYYLCLSPEIFFEIFSKAHTIIKLLII